MVATKRPFDGSLPLAQASTIPSDWYRDPDVYRREQERVFGSSWVYVGRAEQVARPGDFLTANIAGEPILVVRDEEGGLRALANVCRHRAAPVCLESAGQAKRLRCPYHGWTYDLAGQLRGAPEFDGVADFCRENVRLPAYQIETLGRWLFVSLAPTAADLHRRFAPFCRDLESFCVHDFTFVKSCAYSVACNWKVFVDNYLDGGYHVNSIHPGLAGVLDYSQYATELHDHASVQRSPMKSADPDADVNLSAVRAGGWAAYWWLYPNFMVNFYGDGMDTNWIVPRGVDRCEVVFDFYFRLGSTEQARVRETRTLDSLSAERQAWIRESVAASDVIQQEDIAICEAVQRGLGSRTYDTGRFSVRREASAYQFHQLLAGQLNPS